MRAKNLIIALIAVVFVINPFGVALSEGLQTKETNLKGLNKVPDQIIVKFKTGISENTIASEIAKQNASVLHTSRYTGFKVLRIPKSKTVEDMVAIYQRNPNVEYAEPNYIAHAINHSVPPNDPLYSPYQWNLGHINAVDTWDLTTGDGVTVAVVDTGVAYEDYTESVTVTRGKKTRTVTTTYALAPDLANTIFVPGYDFVNNDQHPNDDDSHGTHVAGTVAQSTNNGFGVAGVAYGAAIMPVKVLDASGSGAYSWIADGISYAAQYGAAVINLSLGGSSSSTTLQNAMKAAYEAGSTIVCASGNDGSSTTVSYPAAYDAYCIAVGATDYLKERSYYSNGGASLDVTAPGGDTTIDRNGDGYVDGILQETHDGSDYTNFSFWFFQGTSMAAPHVAGAAALIISHGNSTTPDEVREALQATAQDQGDPGWDPVYGWGIIDAYAAVNYTSASSTNAPPVAVNGSPDSGTEDIAVSFNGSGSNDPDGDAITYSWNFGDGETGSGETPTHTYLAGGDYLVTLTVNDGKVDSIPATREIVIEEVNDPPVANAGADQNVQVGVPVNFDGSGSYDIDADDLITYSWDFGDGNPAGVATSNPIATHTYSTPGNYTVKLTVKDSSGVEDTDTLQINVSESASLQVATIDLALQTKGPNTEAEATIGIRDSSGNAVEGATVLARWSDITSQNVSGVTTSTGEVVLKSGKTREASGTFRVTVTDVVADGYSYSPGPATEGTITFP